MFQTNTNEMKWKEKSLAMDHEAPERQRQKNIEQHFTEENNRCKVTAAVTLGTIIQQRRRINISSILAEVLVTS